MELALTHPTLGYYSRIGRLLRHGGDFSTAPALSPFFNRTLARLVTELVDASLAAAPGRGSAGSAAPAGRAVTAGSARAGCLPSVVELGGGEGHLAREILRFWERERPQFRGEVCYRILEVGTRLRESQASAVSEWAAAGWGVGWGSTLEEACAGTRPVVIVGNEFLDTMPVHLVGVADRAVRETHVETAPSGLVQVWGDLSGEAAAEIESLFGTLDPTRLQTFTDDGILEVFPGLGALMEQVARAMPSGSLVNVDYGEWFPGVPHSGHTRGSEGCRRRTVRGYFKHQMATDTLARAGRQDLTADVDFAAVDRHGRMEGFETVLFTTLSAFLRGGGADEELRRLEAATEAAGTLAEETEASGALETDRQATALRNLVDERDLGSAFKLMVQVKE